MMSIDVGRGLQVVDVRGDHSYELVEDALSALLQPDVRDLPVVVVSVAGAFRGGKSFLLDFILRYLNASDADRKTEAWLGGSHEPLVGFNWRTGAGRDTIGIHIWSRPFRMTTSSGEEVAIVLMDTQGTFDNESSLRDSITIFALSTLLSSVQIYNISGNLKGDDLQNLQLFIEFARLVLNEAGQPFQHLKFLIRDWMFTSEHAFGAEGGSQLLERVLEVKAEQPDQQREVRQHLRACFERIDCFLMAHPGFVVCDANFKGHLADLRPEFRACLLELVPGLLEPSRLLPKRINGLQLKLHEFVHYFRTYLDAFNSGEIPTPATILQATAEAGLALAVEAARAQYASGVAAAHGRLLGAAAAVRLHAAAAAAAARALASRRIVGRTRRDIDDAVDQITQEFDDRLRDFTAINEAKMKKALKEATVDYESRVLADTPEEDICCSPVRLAASHRAAADAVASAFKEKLYDASDDNTETSRLNKDLQARYSQIVRFNERNNNLHLTGALHLYVAEMSRHTEGTCMTPDQLQEKHASAREAAKKYFREKRNDHAEDNNTERLDKEIENKFKNYVQWNNARSESVIATVVAYYKEHMFTVFGEDMKAVSCADFKNKEKRIRKASFDLYYERRIVGENEHDSCFKEITQAIATHCDRLEEQNNKLNNDAVEDGLRQYRAMMDVRTAGLPALLRPISVVLIPLRLVQLLLELDSYHNEAKKKAIERFAGHRNNNKYDVEEPTFVKFTSEMEQLYEEYKNPFIVIGRDLGIH